MIASGPCPEALSGFVKFHPQYPVLKVPGGALARRALRVPAWRKIEYYLARSAVSRTFFRKFLPAVPRAAGRLPPSGLGPFAATSSVLYSPPARRGRVSRPHTGCRQLQPDGAEGACSASPNFSRSEYQPCRPIPPSEAIPPERRTAASGPARLPRGQSPRRPSLVDSLYVSI